MLIPALIGIIILELFKLLKISFVIKFFYLNILSPIVFVLSVFFAIGFPLFYRSFFINKIKEQKMISLQQFQIFEKDLLVITLITPYFVLITSLFKFPEFYFIAITLLAMYSCYFYYPSKKRINFEKKIFRIKEEITES